jgi:formylglycine-generating enzyme required for sulfatase activity
VAKHDHPRVNFVLALLLIGSSAAVGIYRTQRGAQVFSKPLFEPVAPTEVITASEIDKKSARVPITVLNPSRAAVDATEIAFQPQVLAAMLSRTLASRRALSGDELRQLRTLFAPAAADWALVGPARTQVLVALDQATRVRVPEFLLSDGLSFSAALAGVKNVQARRIKTRMNEAIAREGKISRAALLLESAPLTPDQLSLAAANLHAVLKADSANARAAAGLVQLEQRACAGAHRYGTLFAFPEAFELLSIAESQVQGGSEIRAQRAALFIAQANAEAALLQTFSNALGSRNSNLAAESLAKLAHFLPETRINLMRAQITNTELYGGFERGQIFSDRLTLDGAPASATFATAERIGPLLRVLGIGSFVMGSPENEPGRDATEGPQRELRRVHGFAMALGETSVAQFAAFIAATGYTTDADRAGNSIVYDEKTGRMTPLKGVNWHLDYLGQASADNLPVLHVSYSDALEYTRWLSETTGQRYRLASEAEFEYALRAQTKSPYWWGAGTPSSLVENLTGKKDSSESNRTWSSGFANYGDNFWGPAATQSFAPNPFGLFDLGGNVSEWVADCWHESFARAPNDFSAWENPGCAQRVVRGASWGSAPAESRSASRAAFNNTHRSAKIGFRVVRDL